MWNFKGENNVKNTFINYHMVSINEPEFTNSQVYIHKPRELFKNDDCPLIDLEYQIDSNNLFESILFDRKSMKGVFTPVVHVNKKLISQFSQLAMIGGNKENRMYPSGGSQYYVNSYFLFNENQVDRDLVNEGNIMCLNCDTQKLMVQDYQSWDNISEIFMQKYLINTAQFVIVLSCDINNISDKYTDISYKLVQQEAGHIGQNIQLVSTYLGLSSVPLGGFYDIELSTILGNKQTVLYAFIVG